MKQFWENLRSTAAGAVRDYFAPLKHWRQFLAFFVMMMGAFIPFYGWFTQGYTSLGSLSSAMLLSFWMCFTLMGPVMAISFSRIYPSLKRYTVGIALGGLAGFFFMFYIVGQSHFVGATDGLIIIEDGQQQVVEHDDIRRYAPWDERQFITVDNAYGRLETTAHQPCGDTLCATTVTVRYAWSAPFIAANANNSVNYQAITNLAFIEAVNIDGLTNADDIAPAMCQNINAALELDEGSTCPVRLEFGAEVQPIG